MRLTALFVVCLCSISCSDSTQSGSLGPSMTTGGALAAGTMAVGGAGAAAPTAGRTGAAGQSGGAAEASGAGRAVESGANGGSSGSAAGATTVTGVGGEGSAGQPAAGTEGGAGTAAPVKPRLAVTADFLAKRLSIIDIDKLKEGGKRADALVGEVDLSMYAPGPLAVGVTPDGKTAVVSISSGWLSDIDSSIPSGSGGLVFVDLEKRTVIGQLDTGERPMGIIISPDSKRAFVGHYSENYFAVVDIEKRTFERVQTGGSFNEELALDDTGTIGVLTYGPQGNAVTFPIATPTMVGRTSGLSGDAGGVAFFPGTKLAFVIQAPTVLTGNVGGYNVLDVSNPLMPMSTHNVRVNASPVQYPVTTNVARKSIVFPSSQDEMLTLIEMKLEGTMAKEVKKVSLGPAPSIAYGLTSTPDGKVLAAQAAAHFLAVVDMEAGKSFNVAWEQSELGPVDVRMIP
jgi:hypothetical protein